MVGLLTFLIIVASILLIIVVFIQNPKGGGLSSDFGAATQIGGVHSTCSVTEFKLEMSSFLPPRMGI